MGDSEDNSSGSTEPRMFTEEEVRKEILAAQQRQMMADNERVYGNAFFAEALDHIAGLSKTEQFWKDVYAYGMAFKRSFEINTGQVAPQAPPKQQKPKETDPSQNPPKET